MCEQRRTDLLGADLEEERGAFAGFGFVGEDADGAAGLEAVNDPCACGHADAQAFVADGHAAIGADLDGRADAPEVRPPRAARGGAQHAALFPLGRTGGGVGGALEFAMDFVGVAVTTQVRQERVGRRRCGDGFGGEERGQAALPVLVLALDLALGLGRARVAQGDAIEVQGGSELRQGVGALRKEKAVAVHIEFERQAMFGEGGGEEVKVSQEIFTVINGGASADARTVIEEIQQGIKFFVAGEPAMGRGVQLPERADFQALPAADRGGRARRRSGMRQLMGEGPAAHGGGIDLEAQTAVDFGGGAAIGGRRLGGEQFAQERLDASGPVRRVIAARGAGRPERHLRAREGVEIIGVELVEAGAAEAEFFGGDGGADFVAAERGEDFADQGSAETVGELTIMFFKAARIGVGRVVGERGLPPQRAFRRPPLRSGLLQAR
ncbi:MAG: hypothetical protein FD118_4209 [Rhodocyclaceae bacterium]|nr:MAG: hypothetical protein FD118_4209 [Rhodocyclaceae bacterium]